jgi:hypothetical protein
LYLRVAVRRGMGLGNEPERLYIALYEGQEVAHFPPFPSEEAPLRLRHAGLFLSRSGRVLVLTDRHLPQCRPGEPERHCDRQGQYTKTARRPGQNFVDLPAQHNKLAASGVGTVSEDCPQ